MNPFKFEDSVLASSPDFADLVTTSRPSCTKTSVGNSWRVHKRALYSLLVVLIAPSTLSALPLKAHFDYNYVLDSVNVYTLGRRASTNTTSSNGGMSMSVWLPIIAVAIVFLLFSLIICVRRFAVSEATATPATSIGTSGARTGNGTAPRTRRRPRRTPSQISTKSLPAYMKEPGDQELVLFRGPSEDDHLPGTMPTLPEDDEHVDMQNTTFNIALNRAESYDTMDMPTTLIHRPPELHHADGDVVLRRSEDVRSSSSSTHSRESSAELLHSHQRTLSAAVPDPRGEAPSYTEATMTTISLNDPEPSNASSVSRSLTAGEHARNGSRSRFNFLQNPFSSNHSADGSLQGAQASPPSIRAPSPVVQSRNDSPLSRVSSHESHNSNHSRAPSANHTRSPSSLNNILHPFRPKIPASSPTISLDNISAPLTHTVIRAEFHAPKGGILTAEQIKLITSSEGMKKFGVPYGPDAVAAFSLSKDQLVPPPTFDSVAGGHGQPDASGSGSTGPSSTSGEGSETVAQSSDVPSSASSMPASPRSLSSTSSSRQSLHSVVRTGSRASTVLTYATADESGEQLDEEESLYLQAVQAYASDSETDDEDVPLTARPLTPTTARLPSLAGGRGSAT